MEFNEEKETDQSLYEKTFVNFKRGDVIKGKVVQIEAHEVLVYIGGKTEGVIPREELSHKPVLDPKEVVQVGDEIDVYVLSKEGEEGPLRLSKKRAELEAAWIRIKKAYDTGEIIQGTVLEQVKGGLVVDLGVRGFIPASHVGSGKVRVKNLEDYLGETVPLKVLEMDPQRARVVLSYRLAVEEEVKKKKETFWKDIYQWQIRSGRVVRMANFGAFVDLGGIDGLIHLSELSWRRVKHPSEVVKIGDKIEVMVLGFDQSKERVSLSLRRALPDPWTQLPADFTAGALIEGTVTKIVKHYVFVEIYPGIEGLIPRPELSDQKLVSSLGLLNEGDKIKVRILEVKPDARRMVLSLRETEEFKDEDRPLTLKDVLGEDLQIEHKGF